MNWRGVFSDPPASISHAEFNRWYDGHLHEILAFPGFVEARRYSVTPLSGSDAPANYPFASLYLIDGPPEETNMAVRAAVARGEIVHPDWFPLPRSSWSFFPLGNDDEIQTLPASIVVVAATTPPDVETAAAGEWYAASVQPRFEQQLGRPKLSQMVSSMTNEEAPSTADLLGFYESSSRSAEVAASSPGDVVVIGLDALGPSVNS